MYTRCPECTTMFHLTVADLRQAGGRVRCGECTHVFYGMDFLAEEPDEVPAAIDSKAVANDTPAAEPAANPESEASLPDFDDDDEPDVSEILYVSDDNAAADSNADDEQDTQDDADSEVGNWAAEALADSDQDDADDDADEWTADERDEADQDDSEEDDADEWAATGLDEADPDDAEDEDDDDADDWDTAQLNETDQDDAEDDEDEDDADDWAATELDDADPDDAEEDGDDDDEDDEDDWTTVELNETDQDDDDTDEDDAEDWSDIVVGDASEAASIDELAAVDNNDAVASDTESDDPEAELAEDSYEIDDTIWEKIPGVGSLGEETAEPVHTSLREDDTGAFLADSDDDDDESARDDEHADEFDDAEQNDTLLTESESVPTFSEEHENAAEEPEDEVALADTTLEFNVPEEEWSTVFETDTISDIQTEKITPVILDPVTPEENETPADEAPPWQFNKYSNIDLSRYDGYAGRWLAGAIICLIGLATQLVHYNRDALAAHPDYGANVRSMYAALGQPLFPEWSIDNYEIRGSEAVVGETGPDVMDIRTQIAAIGDAPIGLPLLRVTLNDRWSNPVAARHFNPEEYATDALPADNLLMPNSSIGAHLSIIDPGSGAQGYELELCIPQRDEQLRCSGRAFK